MRASLLLLALLVIGLFTPVALSAITVVATGEKPVVAVDLAHGESDKYLDYIMGNITFVEWKVLKDKITSDVLADVDVLIIGQPTVGFDAEEIQAIIDWLSQGNKAIWVASDSDYGGGPTSQQAANDLLEAIGSKLRIETGAVYDDVFNCQRFYRVLGTVRPDLIWELKTYIISDGVIKPVLFHGPSVVIWVDDEGNPHDPVTEVFPGLIRIVWTSPLAYIADNNPPPLTLYDPLIDRSRSFVMLAAEYQPDLNNIIIASGESPYGDYEPTWASEYYDVELDGPKFVTNMIKWIVTLITEGPEKPAPETVTVTQVKTTTQKVTETTTVEKTITTTSVKEKTVVSTTPTTITETVTDWTMVGIVGIILLIIGLLIGFLAKKK